MYSVIVPTLWRYNHFEQSLQDVLHHNLVGEVIVINNDNQRTPEWFKDISSEKITLVDFNENIYVNASWNHGVHISKFNKICLMNDDIGFSNFVFDFLYQKINQMSGVIGLHRNCCFGVDENSTPEIQDCFELDPGSGFGCLMFLDKRTYPTIPSILKIYCGDDWIFSQNLKQGLIPKTIKNFPVWGHIALTSAEAIFDKIKSRDIEIYSRMKQYGKF